jgi:tellurite resistance protein TerC
LTDILFAIDSVPAAFAVTRTTFLIYSSNAFAILGLRSLYAVLAELISGLRFLHYGLAAILGFAAIKITLSSWIHIHPLLSVVIIVVLIGRSVVASLLAGKTKA